VVSQRAREIAEVIAGVPRVPAKRVDGMLPHLWGQPPPPVSPRALVAETQPTLERGIWEGNISTVCEGAFYRLTEDDRGAN
jgi:hypothetical protein